MFRFPRHLAGVYMYIIMFDMYLLLRGTFEISIFAKYVIFIIIIMQKGGNQTICKSEF